MAIRLFIRPSLWERIAEWSPERFVVDRIDLGGGGGGVRGGGVREGGLERAGVERGVREGGLERGGRGGGVGGGEGAVGG